MGIEQVQFWLNFADFFFILNPVNAGKNVIKIFYFKNSTSVRKFSSKFIGNGVLMD